VKLQNSDKQMLLSVIVLMDISKIHQAYVKNADMTVLSVFLTQSVLNVIQLSITEKLMFQTANVKMVIILME
jgi:hypothetical protein